MWDGDSLEIAFGLNPNSDPGRKSFDKTDFQLAFLVNEPKKNNLQDWSWQLNGAPKDVRYALSKNKRGTGYILEAAIPWSSFLSFVPSENTAISFNAALNNAREKDKGREVQMVWTGNSGFYQNPAMWGWLKFVK